MSNAVFPTLPGLAFPVEKTAMWSTRVQTGVSGKETRLNLWSYPIWKYSLPFEMLRSDSVNAELQSLAGFYNARQGSYDTWLFDDPDDDTATLQNFGVGDGSTRSFQLKRSYGGFSEPVGATNVMTQVRVNAVATGAYTVNASTGILTFTTAPGAGLALDWSGTYYWRCRFDGDEFNVSKFVSQIWDAKAVKFMSVK